MVITCIAKLQNRPYSGVDVVVPKHLISQQKYADVCLYNLYDAKTEGVDKCYMHSEMDFQCLPSPYNHPDLVVFHEAYNIENIKIYKYLLKNEIPYIIVPHGELTIEAQRRKRLKKKLANILLFNKFINDAIAIQNLSEREMISTQMGRVKFVGTNGIFMPNKMKQAFNKDFIKFVYIGRLDIYYKGLDLLLDSVFRCAEFMCEHNAKLYIYGPVDEEYEKLESIIHDKRLENIVVLNHGVFGLEKEKVLLDSDIFIQTSRSEGMPMGILEALSYGLPCIVTEGTTLAENIDTHNAGWSCDNTVEGICRCICNAIDQRSLYTQKSVNARKYVKETFEWDKVAKDNIVMYECLARNVRGDEYIE